MARTGSKVWQRAQANKKRIYFSAMRLFSERGYDNVSVDDIVREANSSKGTFYNYFRSKDELFVFYNQSLDERFLSFYQRLLAGRHYAGGNGLDKLYLMVLYTLHTLAESGREFTAISDMRQLREESAGDGEDVLCNIVREVFPALVEMGKRDGSIDRTVDSEQAVLLLYFYLKGIVDGWERCAPPDDLVTAARPALAMLCSSLAPPSAARTPGET